LGSRPGPAQLELCESKAIAAACGVGPVRVSRLGGMEHQEKKQIREYTLYILEYATGVQNKLINNATKPRAHIFF